MSIRVSHNLGDLVSDMSQVGPIAVKDMHGIVKDGARIGGLEARANAKRTAADHGRHYPSAITWDRSARSYYGFGGGAITAEYGPETGRRQGGMSFEDGSRNQPPHWDLAKSARLVGPAMAGELRSAMDDWFWPA
ncbi:hypothetical protein ACFVJS_03810 [Nocardioides sp. NPDC057772]|uniref:hypothetical protein n=1 Tax=Nocardioides sp. NPDC057772 TaxID=3346245 RepID=UPI0036727C9A